MPQQTRSRSFGGRHNQYKRRVGGPQFSGNNRRSSGRKGPKKDYIDPSRFVRRAQHIEIEQYVPLHRFSDFQVNPVIAKNLETKGFEAPSAIQDQAIPHALQGRDIIGIADTGTGKTAAFGIPVINRLMQSDSRVIVMAPTRELAQQIDSEFRWMAKGSGLAAAVLIGGSAMGPQLRDLRANPQVVIGTPGRIKDHLERGSLKLDNCDTVVLDEVDRMLDMGFINDMRDILKQLPSERQSLFFSATMDRKVNDLIETFSNDPITISVKTGDTSANVHQDVVRVDGSKIDALHDLLIGEQNTKTIIFDDTQRAVERLSKELVSRGFSADAIHGGKTQGQRSRSLQAFRDNKVSVLVATDVAARGIDIKDVTHVINYSTPQTYDDYVHRIGRAGRAGQTGYAYTFIER